MVYHEQGFMGLSFSQSSRQAINNMAGYLLGIQAQQCHVAISSQVMYNSETVDVITLKEWLLLRSELTIN